MTSNADPRATVTVDGHQLSLLQDGVQVYPAMLAAIRSARRSVLLETYIFREDSCGEAFAAALMERARAGVEVKLMFDGWGSHLSDDFLEALQLAGVSVLEFRPFRWQTQWRRFATWLRRRNHRKTLVVDDHVGFTGGLNISNDYATIADGGRAWRDTHLRIEGPTAERLAALFRRTWRRAGGTAWRERSETETTITPGASLRIVDNDFYRHAKDIRREYLLAFQRATATIYLTHAYFLPPSRLLKALTRAAYRGVRVKIIIASTTDVPLVRMATRGLYRRLLASGIEVYEWHERILHAKTAVIDGRWSTVGSANLDALSLRNNLEVNAVIENEAFAHAMEEMFEDDLRACSRVSEQTVANLSWLERAMSWLAFQVRHWL